MLPVALLGLHVLSSLLLLALPLAFLLAMVLLKLRLADG
jgi:hypothetical protein